MKHQLIVMEKNINIPMKHAKKTHKATNKFSSLIVEILFLMLIYETVNVPLNEYSDALLAIEQ